MTRVAMGAFAESPTSVMDNGCEQGYYETSESDEHDERHQEQHKAATRSQEGGRTRGGESCPMSSGTTQTMPIGRKRLRRPLFVAVACLALLMASTINCQTTTPATPTTSTLKSQTEPTSTATSTASTPPPAPIESSFEPTQASNVSLSQQQHNKLKPINFTLVDEIFESTLDENEVLRRWRNMDGQFQDGIRSILKLVFPQIVAISQDAKVSGDCSGGILKWILSLRNLRSWAIKMLDATGKPTAGIFEGSLTMFGNHRQCLSIRAPDEDEIEITDQFEEYFRGQFCVLHLRPWLATKRPFYHLNSTIEPLLRKNYKYYEKTLYDELAEIAIAFNFLDIRMDLCVPSTCTMADLQRVADLLSRKLEMKAKVMRCDIESRESTSAFVQNLDLVTSYWLIVPVGMVLITLTSSLLVLLNVSDRSAISPGQRLISISGVVYCLSIQGALSSLLSCPKRSTGPTRVQSVHDSNNNGASGRLRAEAATSTPRKWLDKEEILKKPWPLYGLRSVFVVWFVIVQLTVELKYQYLRESLVLRNMMLAYWPFQIIINTSMIFQSLILITAFTYSYANLEITTKGLLGYILNKYVRLVPSIITLVLVTIILPSIGITSPVWKNFVEQQSSVCKSNGYLDLFFLQNFISYNKICLSHTWLFCVELQLVALSIPLVILLKKTFIHNEDSIIIAQSDKDLARKRSHSKRESDKFQLTLVHLLKSRAGLLGVVLVVIGAAINFFVVYTNQLPPAWFHTFPDTEQKSYYFGKYLTKTWTHLTTFIIGLYAGYLCRSTIQLSFNSNGNNSSSNSATIGHLHAADDVMGQDGHGSSKEEKRSIGRTAFQVSLLCPLLALIFGTFAWSTQELPSPFVSALYDSLSRLVWSLALAGLMVQLCLSNECNQMGTYSRLSGLFSHSICIVLGRLSFLAYLVAPLVHTFVLAVQEQSLFPSLYLIFHVILGNIVITYMLAFILSVMIEQPIRLVTKQLCCINTRTRVTATISATSTTPSTTTTSATSLAN